MLFRSYCDTRCEVCEIREGKYPFCTRCNYRANYPYEGRCYTCQYLQSFDKTTRQCVDLESLVNCRDFKEDADGNRVCTACQPNYALNEWNMCVPTPKESNCLYDYNIKTKHCDQCENAFYWDKAEYKCIRCTLHCLRCKGLQALDWISAQIACMFILVVGAHALDIIAMKDV